MPRLFEESENPLGKVDVPINNASSINFLASPTTAWVNGQILRANGGLV